MFCRRSATGAGAVVLALVLVVSGLVAVPASAQPRQVQAYEGAAKIGNLDRITVVFPAAAAENEAAVRFLRDNARIKASYLTQRYGVIAEIARDDALTDEQRSGHLLVLGWDNRLTADDWFGQVVRRDDTRRFFLGVPAGARDDLLWMHVNPYNPKKYLVFWSRQDADLDRLLPFPFVGSDWAWYRDYFIRYQGNFNGTMEWPPVREPLAEHDEALNPLPLAEVRGHYAIHHMPDLIDDATRARILDNREQALATAADSMDVGLPDGLLINLYVYRDDATKHRETGVSDPVHSLPSRKELFMTTTRAQRTVPQEEIHLLAGAVWGQCQSAAMSLGLAIYLQADPRDQGAYAALLVEQDAVPSVADLFDDEKLRAMSRTGYGFPAAALMVEWIADTGGNDALSAAYGSLRSDASSTLAAALELEDSSAVEASFADWMRQRASGATADLAYRRARDRARERARVGDTVGQVEALRKALEVRPEETALAYRIALVHMDAGDYDAARRRLREILARTPPAQPAWVPVFSRIKLAELAAASDDPDSARTLYQAVLAGPDEHDAHRYAREGLEALGKE